MRTLAAIATKSEGPLVLDEVDLDDPRPDEVLVEMAAVGICHTDSSARDQRLPCPLPMIFGHEGAGTILAVGSGVQGLAEGDQVLLVADRCGDCPPCRAAQPTYCANVMDVIFSGLRRDGSTRARWQGEALRSSFFGQSSFAHHALASERNVLKVGPSAPLQHMAALTCGVPTGAGSILYGLSVTAGSSVLVVGAGAVGLGAVMAAAASGATTIVAVDRVPERLELALRLGATAILDTTNLGKAGVIGELASQVRHLTGGGCDAALDTTGDPSLLASAIDSLATLGVCGFVTTRGPRVEVPLASMLVQGKAMRGLMGGHAPPDILIPRLLELHGAGLFPYEQMVVHYRFEDINEAMDDGLSGRSVKPVLLFEP